MDALTLRRDIRTDKAILGRLYLNGALVCFTLENAAKAIPCGLYKLQNGRSPKFARELPLVYDSTMVKPSRGIRIHRGNTHEDSAGCILVGMKRDADKPRIYDSADAEKMVVMLCRNTFNLVIVEE